MRQGPFQKHTLFAGLSLFLLLVSIYLLRSIRDEAAVRSGIENLGWLMSVSFTILCVVSLWGRSGKSQAPVTFKRSVGLVSVLLLLFTWCHSDVLLFLLIGVANLLLISLFWGVLNSRFHKSKAGQDYPRIMLIGSSGVIVGPLLVTTLARSGLPVIGLTTAFLLIGSILLITRIKPVEPAEFPAEHPGSVPNQTWPIAALILLYSLLGTVLYGEHLAVVELAGLTSAERLHFFGKRDLWVGVLTFALQFLNQQHKQEAHWIGFRLMPVLTLTVLLSIGLYTSLETVLWSMVLFRSFNYSYVRPAREIYHLTGLNRFKVFIDTVIYRAGDLIGIWLFQLLMRHDFNYLQVGLMMVPLIIAWVILNKKIVKTLNA